MIDQHRRPIAIGPASRGIDAASAARGDVERLAARPLGSCSVLFLRSADRPCPPKCGDEPCIDLPGAEPHGRTRSRRDLAPRVPPIGAQALPPGD